MQENFLQMLLNGFKGRCRACGRHAQVYNRSIHFTTAWQLIRLYRLGGAYGFIHASRLIPPGQTGTGDLGKAKYFGLIEQKGHDEGKKKHSGYWKLTERGVLFVRGNIPIEEFVGIFDDKVISKATKLVNIQDCLGKKFDYQKLMEGEAA